MPSHTRSLTLTSLLVLLATLLTFNSPQLLYASGEPGDAKVEYGGNPPSLSSTVNSIQIVFAKDGTESKIWLRICSDAPNAQMRAENVGQWTTEVFHRTEKSNGCYPSSDGWYKMVYGIDTGSTSTFRIYATANDGILSEAAFMQRAASYDCHLTGWGTGYCTPNNISASVGSIDEPSAGQAVQGSVTVRGWAIDSASQNGTSITEVKVKVNGAEVGTANYGEPRTDVAGAYSDGRYGSSGYRISFDSRQFANGTANVQVTYRSVISGNWTTMDRQVVINNPVTPTPIPPTPTPIPPIPPTPTPSPTITRSRLFLDSRRTLVLEFCGTNIHQDVFVGAKRVGKDFGTRPQRVDFGNSEQCAINDRILDGSPRLSLVYEAGVALSRAEVYSACNSSRGSCSSFTMPAPPSVGFKLPFPGGTAKKLTQGNSTGSHTGSIAKYAFDWGIGVGQPVAAARAGRVIELRDGSSLHGCNRNFFHKENYILIRHDNGTDSLYAHLRANSLRVKKGDFVQSGQIIADVGLSGYVCGAHLHYAVRPYNSGSSIASFFVDVPDNDGIPVAGRMYTSGNYLAQLLSETIALPMSTQGIVPPEGSAIIRLTNATTYTLQLNAYDYESDELKMRVSTTQVGLETALWQAYVSELPWTSSQAWVQYQDADGLTSEVYSDTILPIAYQPIQAEFTAPANVCTNEFVEIENLTAATCPQCAWKWLHGDGTSSTSIAPSTGDVVYGDIAYGEPGIYTVSFSATNAVTESNIAKQITVQASPSADFTMIRVGTEVTFVATDTTATAWEWDLGDGTTATGRVIKHIYDDDGSIAQLPPVQLIVTAANACQSDSLDYIPTLAGMRIYLPLTIR